MNFVYKLFEDKTKHFFDTAENCHRPECNAVTTGRSKNHTLAQDIFFSQALFVLGRSTISSMDCLGPDRHRTNPERTRGWETNNWRGPRGSLTEKALRRYG